MDGERRSATLTTAAAAVAAALVLGACARETDAPAVRSDPASALPRPAGPPVPESLPPIPAPSLREGPRVEPLVVLVASDDDVLTRDLGAGIRAAFDEAREGGGPALTLHVTERSSRWGSAVEAAVTEALDAGALAVVAPPERRNAHLLAQFATRAKVPLLSTSPARSVVAAGSTWVVAVVPTVEAFGDGPPAEPGWSEGESGALRERLGREPGPWERAGWSAGRAAAAAVRANGLRREGFVAAALESAEATR